MHLDLEIPTWTAPTHRPLQLNKWYRGKPTLTRSRHLLRRATTTSRLRLPAARPVGRPSTASPSRRAQDGVACAQALTGGGTRTKCGVAKVYALALYIDSAGGASSLSKFAGAAPTKEPKFTSALAGRSCESTALR